MNEHEKSVNWKRVGAIAGVIAVLIALGVWLVPNAVDFLSARLSETPTATLTRTPTAVATVTPKPPTDTPTVTPTSSPTRTPVIPTVTPSFTPAPPTSTPIPPTSTPVPPTAAPVVHTPTPSPPADMCVVTVQNHLSGPLTLYIDSRRFDFEPGEERTIEFPSGKHKYEALHPVKWDVIDIRDFPTGYWKWVFWMDWTEWGAQMLSDFYAEEHSSQE